MNTDITTKDGWNNYLDIVCKGLTEIAADGEMKLSRCDLILTANPETGEAWAPSIYSVLMHFRGDTDEEVEAYKDNQSAMLRAIGIAGCAIGSVFASEAWVSTISIDDKERLANRKQPKDDPKRKEGIFLSIAHRDFGNHTRSSMIEHVDKKRRLGAWLVSGNANFAGRFGSFVPTDGVLTDAELIKHLRNFVRHKQIMGDLVPIEKYIADMEKGEAS